MIKSKSTYREQVELVADIQMNGTTFEGVKKLRSFLINHGYEAPADSDEALEVLRNKLGSN